MISHLAKMMKNKQMTTMVKLITMKNSVGTPKKPTSTNKAKMKINLKKSISKRKETKITKTKIKTRKTRETKKTKETRENQKERSLSNLEKIKLEKTKSKMMKTDTKRANIRNIINADLKGLIMTNPQRVEMTTEVLLEVVWATLTGIKDILVNNINNTPTGAMMISMLDLNRKEEEEQKKDTKILNTMMIDITITIMVHQEVIMYHHMDKILTIMAQALIIKEITAIIERK